MQLSDPRKLDFGSALQVTQESFVVIEASDNRRDHRSEERPDGVTSGMRAPLGFRHRCRLPLVACARNSLRQTLNRRNRCGDRRELDAEAVAFAVGGTVGLDTAGASRDYIHLSRGDREAPSGSLDRIQRARP